MVLEVVRPGAQERVVLVYLQRIHIDASFAIVLHLRALAGSVELVLLELLGVEKLDESFDVPVVQAVDP